MSDDQRNCPDCGADLKRGAVSCRCGWKVDLAGAMHAAAEAARQEELRQAEEKRAREREERYVRLGKPAVEKSFVSLKGLLSAPRLNGREHWRRVLASPSACFAAKEAAREALSRLESAETEREPGSDDEAVPA